MLIEIIINFIKNTPSKIPSWIFFDLIELFLRIFENFMIWILSHFIQKLIFLITFSIIILLNPFVFLIGNIKNLWIFNNNISRLNDIDNVFRRPKVCFFYKWLRFLFFVLSIVTIRCFLWIFIIIIWKWLILYFKVILW